MAARIKKGLGRLSQEWRERIRLGVILQRLDACAAGEIEMTPDQVQAAKIILAKMIPDLKAVEHTGADGGPIEHTVTKIIIE